MSNIVTVRPEIREIAPGRWQVMAWIDHQGFTLCDNRESYRHAEWLYEMFLGALNRVRLDERFAVVREMRDLAKRDLPVEVCHGIDYAAEYIEQIGTRP